MAVVEVCEPCVHWTGFEREVLSRRQAQARADSSGGSLRAYECPCDEPGVWHVLEKFRRGLSGFTSSGP